MKKVEISLPVEVYEMLLEISYRQHMELDKYIFKIVEEHYNYLNQLSLFKDTIIEDLENLILKIKNIEKEDMQEGNNAFTLVSLNEYKGKFSNDLNIVINTYVNDKIFNEENFYLIFRNDENIGYVGISLESDLLPFGDYGYIYTLYIQQANLNITDLHKILCLLQNKLKKKYLYNIDIVLSNSVLTLDQLKKIGFNEFYLTLRLKAKIRNNNIENIDTAYEKESQRFDMNKMKSYLTFNVFLPINKLLRYYDNNKENITYTKFNFHCFSQSIEFILISEEIPEKNIFHYSIFMDPVHLFQQEVIKKAYKIVLKEISHKDSNDVFIIDIPKELNSFIGKYVEIVDKKKNTWLRLNNY